MTMPRISREFRELSTSYAWWAMASEQYLLVFANFLHFLKALEFKHREN